MTTRPCTPGLWRPSGGSLNSCMIRVWCTEDLKSCLSQLLATPPCLTLSLGRTTKMSMTLLVGSLFKVLITFQIDWVQIINDFVQHCMGITNLFAVIVNFPLEEDPSVKVLAWTTTPWTLPSNLTLCVHPELVYVKVKGAWLQGYICPYRVCFLFHL